MKKIIQFCLVALGLCSIKAIACDTPASVCFKPGNGSFNLINNNQPVAVVFGDSADASVQRVAKSFTADLARVSGNKASTYTDLSAVKNSVVLIGVIGQNKLIDGLIAADKLTVSDIEGQWEGYKIAVVENPWPNVKQALVIVGSDHRGAIFGTYDVSAQMGVSPWYWFADVATTQQSSVYITSGSRVDKPVVRYRGIFINDEDPALGGWAKNKFGGVNAQMYEHVFELILRLKGNYIWPAMWGKSFHTDDPENTQIADKMGMVIGTSHHEPMTRAHKEWHKSDTDPTIGGAWNYETNADNLEQFWRGGIERMMSKGDGKGYESLVTIGMRGDGDEPMSEGTATKLLENIVDAQRKVIADVTGKPASETPQVWALYKEVQDYYDKGMTVPDDVTLLFADDNWGQIRRLPTKDLNRKGGYGVYYHYDYVGLPRNYKWTNTVQIEKVWQQMNLAFERGARDLWVVNVGDIKPIEYPIDFFLNMAWNPQAMTPKVLANYADNWAGQTFGKNLAKDIASLVNRYSKYAARRKPELINKDTYSIGTANDLVLDGGEFYQHIKKWQALEADMEKVKAKISPEQYSAFYQLIEYPIASLSNLYDLYFSAAWNHELSFYHDQRANHFRKRVEDAWQKDQDLVDKYHSINNGKWDRMMSQVHMNYVIWNDPTKQTMPPVMQVYGGRNNIDVHFAEKKVEPNIVEIDASAFDHAINNAGFVWSTIPHLGQSTAAVLALPQGKSATTVADEVRVEYKFSRDTAANLKVTLALSPTIDTIGSNGINIGVSYDDSPVQILNFNLLPSGGITPREEEKSWIAAVTNNKHSVDAIFENVAKGDHTLKVWRLDDNVILEQLVLEQLPLTETDDNSLFKSLTNLFNNKSKTDDI